MSDLTFLEFVPILVVNQMWGDIMASCMVHFWCGNLVVVHIINSLMAKSFRVTFLVREFTLCCLKLNTLFVARHVPRVVNGVTNIVFCKQSFVSWPQMLTSSWFVSHQRYGSLAG